MERARRVGVTTVTALAMAAISVVAGRAGAHESTPAPRVLAQSGATTPPATQKGDTGSNAASRDTAGRRDTTVRRDTTAAADSGAAGTVARAARDTSVAATSVERDAQVMRGMRLLAVWALLVLLVVAAAFLYDAIGREEGARVETHWGGFGGEGGGWRVSPAIIYFLLVIFFGGLLATLLPDEAPAKPQETAVTTGKQATK